MKAAIYRKIGDPSVIAIEDISEPTHSAGQVLIRVRAVCIESGDLLRRRFVDPGANPNVPGYSAAGEVVAIGEAVEGFKVGDIVTSFAYDGAYAELRAAPANQCFLVPRGMDFGVAAATPVAFGTASLALRLGAVQPKDAVLVVGATGGVGLAMVQLASRIGARVIGVARRAEALARARPFGLSDVVAAGEGLEEKVRALTNSAGADVLLDNVGGDAFLQGLRALRDGGRAVIVGISGPGEKTVFAQDLLLRRLSVFGCFIGPIFADPEIRSMIEVALKGVASGELTIPIDRRFPLEEIAEAHRRAESPNSWGRVIVNV